MKMAADAAMAAARAVKALPTDPQQHTTMALAPPDDPNPRPAPSSTAKPTASALERLWERMLALYGNTWASQFGVEAKGIAAQTWASALVGVTSEQLAVGLNACVVEGREFPPNAPRFRAMCFGVPKFERVQLELRKPDTASRFTRAVWLHVDGHRYRAADTARGQEAILRAAYDLVHEAVMRGEPLPDEPVAALEMKAPPAPKITPGLAESKLAEIRRILEPTAEERAAEEKREQERQEAVRIARELAQRSNEPAPDDDEPFEDVP